MAVLEFYFDFSCPYAYVGSTRIEAVAAEVGAELNWRPMLLGGVFRDIGASSGGLPPMPAAKARHNANDMQRWAEKFGVPLNMPAGHPRRTVRALRALLSLPTERWSPFIHEIYREYWVAGRDIAEPAVVAEALDRAGVGAAEKERALAANDDPAIKQALREATDTAVSRGVFGAPTTFVRQQPGADCHMFFGQDRFDMIAATARGWDPEAAPPGDLRPPEPPPAPPGGAEIQFWYDFSSPFAYLASTQIERVAARAGATLTWRPMLLGALFRDVGTANVPLAAFSESKRNYMARELNRWANWWEVPFAFSSHFPIRTVTALRLALAAGDDIAGLSHALFRAVWVDNRDVNDEQTLRDILSKSGRDPGLLDATSRPEIKQQLFANTEEAKASGVFGAPTCIVRGSGTEELYWGQDRLDLAEAAARRLS